jgi:hypothetical protein
MHVRAYSPCLVLCSRLSLSRVLAGGSSIVTSNTVFTNGDVDPWHILGNYQNYTIESGSQSILIHGTAHCADLYAPQPTDLPGLTAARGTQDALLSGWLNQPVKSEQPKKKTPKKVLVEL